MTAAGGPGAGGAATGSGRRVVLVTGATGRIGFPLARHLAADPAVATVYGLARCSRPGDPERLVDAGVVPVVGDVDGFDPATLPEPPTHVFHAAARLGAEAATDPGRTFAVNAQASGRLLAASAAAGASAFAFCSTGSVYAYQGQRPLSEDDPYGVHLGTYSLSKIAAEAVVRFAATETGLATTILRVFSTYGPSGGAPADRLARIVAGKEVVLHPDAPNNYNPIYEDDYVRLAARALEVAAVPPVVVNLAGSETVSAEDYCAYLGELVGRPVRIRYDETAPWSLWPDTARMHEVLGTARVRWRDGMRRMVEARGPTGSKSGEVAVA